MEGNRRLYLWQGLACIFVLQMHCAFPGKVGEGLTIIGRFAVGLFFAISGYFLTKGHNFNIIKTKIFKLLRYFIIALVTYAIYLLIDGYINNCWSINFSAYNILKTVAFNDTSFIVGPLWFLLALIYCYLFYYLLCRVFKEKVYNALVVISAISLIISYFFRIYMVSIINNEQLYYNYAFVFRNWIFLGIPFFTLGLSFKRYKNKIKEFSDVIALGIVLLGIALEILEAYVIRLDVDYYLGSGVAIIGIFLWAGNYKEKEDFILARLGQKYALFVYLWHRLIMYILINVYQALGMSENVIIKWITPFIVFLITLVLAIVINKSKNEIAARKIKGNPEGK